MKPVYVHLLVYNGPRLDVVLPEFAQGKEDVLQLALDYVAEKIVHSHEKLEATCWNKKVKVIDASGNVHIFDRIDYKEA